MRRLLLFTLALSAACTNEKEQERDRVPDPAPVEVQPEPEPQGGPGGGWSCAAYCITEYECKSDGDSTSTAELLTSDGATAAAAFRALSEQCKDGPHAALVTHASCSSGKLQRQGAPMTQVCARN